MNLPNQTADGVENSVGTGSMTDKVSIKQTVVLKDKLAATSATNNLNLSSVSTSVKKDLKCSTQQVILVKSENLSSTANLAQISGSPQEHPIHHIHHHHYVHHFHNMDGKEPMHKIDDLSFKKLTADAPHFGSLNVFVAPIEGDGGNYNLNKSGSGSKHGSTGQNGSSTVVHAGGTNTESDVLLTGKSGSGDVSGTGSRSRKDQNKFEHREAALTKFRQKKKDRQLGNKVINLELCTYLECNNREKIIDCVP